MSAPVIGAVDIGGTKIAVGLVDTEGHILAQAELPTAPELGYRVALERISSSLRSFRDDTNLDIIGIGVGSAGPIDFETGVYGEVGTLPGWEGSPLGADLAECFRVRVLVENDADAGALGEAVWGAGRSSKSSIYVTVSTGIGVGVILEDVLYRGSGHVHPEIGHHLVDAGSDAPLCYCGARGCWESLASGTAMETWFEGLTGDSIIASEICELARQGDPNALKAVEREVRYLGLGLANLVTIFCPETIILGGGMMRSADLLLEPVKDVVRRTVTQVPVANTSIVPAQLDRQSGLLGAASVWFYRTNV